MSPWAHRVALALLLFTDVASAQAPRSLAEVPGLPATDARSPALGAAFRVAAASLQRDPPPVRRGGRNKLEWWIDHQLAPWLGERFARASELERACFRIYLRPTMEGASAAALIGVVLDDFVRQLESVPLPASYDPDGLLRRAYLPPLSRFRERAATAYARCSRTAGSIGAEALAAFCAERAAALDPPRPDAASASR